MAQTVILPDPRKRQPALDVPGDVPQGQGPGGQGLGPWTQFQDGPWQAYAESTQPGGLVESGNIDLAKRPVVKNPDGTISTVRSMSFNDGQHEVLIPTVAADGSRILSDDEAIQQFRESGQHLGRFDTPDNATAYAQKLHQEQAQQYGQPRDGPWQMFQGGQQATGGADATKPSPYPGLEQSLQQIEKELQGGAAPPGFARDREGQLVPTGVPSWKTGPLTPDRPSYMLEPDLYTKQSGGMLPEELPRGVTADEAGAPRYRDSDQPVPIVPRMNVSPLVPTPEGMQLHMPNVWDILGSMTGGPAAATLPRAIKEGQAATQAGEHMLGVFGGSRARTFDPVRAAASNMARDLGVPEDEAWRMFQYAKGAEGKMRFEIDDSKAAFKPDAVQKLNTQFRSANDVPLNEVLEHPSLFKNYPEFKNVKIKTDATLRPGEAYFEPPSPENYRTLVGARVVVSPHKFTANPTGALQSVLHEVQHGVQFMEGFSQGASTEGIFRTLMRSAPAAVKKGLIDPQTYTRFNTLSPKERQELIYRIYRRYAGETEARNVEARQQMTPGERQQYPPSMTEDTARSRQIVDVEYGGLGSGGPSSMRQARDEARSVAKGIEKIFSPTTISDDSRQAEAIIREASGRAARDTMSTEAALEPFMRRINQMPPADQLELIRYIENRSRAYILTDPTLQPVADTIRKAMELRKSKIQNLSSTALAEFVDDYYTHLWKDPAGARAKLAATGGKEGTGRFLKGRVIPTVEDGLRLGLEPVTTNPIDTTLRYVSSMDRFIAMNESFEAGQRAGSVKFFTPGKHPEGWTELQGRLGQKTTPAGLMKAYAPDDWARIYNNYIDRGFHRWAEIGDAYDVARRTSNFLTSVELGLSGFHAFTMAKESIVSDFARAVGAGAAGDILKLFTTAVQAPFAPVMSAVRGRKLQRVYLGKAPATQDFGNVADLLTEAGGRGAGGARHALDYEYSALGSYWKAWRRGSLKTEALADVKDIQGRPVVGTAKVLARNLGRIMSTVSYPLFEKYIPHMKNGAFYDTMAQWLRVNPTATREQQVLAARKIWDSIDNRFGEMVQDNIFWNKQLKQSAMLGMRSYSWFLGTVREIGGGVKDIVRHPSSLSMRSEHFSPRAAYVISLPVTMSLVNSTYQYLMTGKGPETVEDLVAPRTGGAVAGAGGRGRVPERAATPGYEKDVLGWYWDWRQEVANKRSRLVSLTGELVTGKDWRGDPIADPDASVPGWLKAYMRHVTESFVPISFKQTLERKAGSNIPPAQRLMGISPARGFLEDPQGYERMLKSVRGSEWRRKQRHDRTKKRVYGGPD